jgi:hypothetical protein
LFVIQIVEPGSNTLRAMSHHAQLDHMRTELPLMASRFKEGSRYETS